MYNKVVGKKILVFGDLHLSDVYSGKHKNYLSNCFDVLKNITKTITESNPSAVVLLGDLIGWTETNIRNREVLSTICKEFQKWNTICPVYAVRGNHDIKGYPDFNFLADMGLIITSSVCNGYFDYYADETQTTPEIRCHIVDYGCEDTALNILEGTSNIVFGHNNYTINGATTWYSAGDGIELGMLRNFEGVDYVISGHIHNPSPEVVYTSMPNGAKCGLIYAGCPTRPVKDKENYNNVWVIRLEYNDTDKSTDIEMDDFPLKDAKELFYTDEELLTNKSEDEIQEELRKEHLSETLESIMSYRIVMGDYTQQVDNIPNASEKAKELAKKYILLAENRSA